MLEKVLSTIEARRAASLEGLREFLRIASISTSPTHRDEVRRCAEWLSAQLQSMGLSSEVAPTGGHPVVLARNEHKAGRPTLLVYGHYDVQPPDPLEEWVSPPFEPEVRENAVYARGAADDKGQVWVHLEAMRAWQAEGGLPINVILLLEGEEEIGSEHLAAFIEAHRQELRADLAAISDTSQFARGVPSITYGLRGLVYMEVIVHGPNHDLHSGLYGGAVPNPANELCKLLTGLWDTDGRVTIEGFYDDVVPLAQAEREAWKALPFDEREFAAELGLSGLTGEKGYSTLERRWARPTCDINGLSGGYQGEGAKTIIPARASAKVSMRLVPNQEPEKIRATFERTLRRRCPETVRLEVIAHGMSDPILVPREGRPIQLAAEAVERGFGVKPTLMREGGSIPVVAMLKSLLGVETLLVGFRLPDDRIHSPNEKFDLDALQFGTRTAAILYEKLVDLKG